MSRMRHTSRTDSAMDSDRRQVSVRLDGDHRARMKDVVEGGMVPDIRTESDIMQDAIWLWFHEYDLMVERGLLQDGKNTPARKARDRVGPEATDAEEAQGVEVGSPT